MSNHDKSIISRRSRPAKDPLSKDIIVQTAFKLMMDEGISGLSMRKIAKALDTGASSLYVYVKNLQELRAYVLDYRLKDVKIPNNKNASWKEGIFEVLHSYYTVLYQSPGMAELALTTVPVGSHSSAIIEYILKQLDLGSIRSTSAAWGADLLLLYTTSVAYEQTSRNQKGQDSTLISTYLHSLEGSQYPMISSMKKEIFSGESERFQWGIEAVLQGISVLKDGKKPLN